MNRIKDLKDYEGLYYFDTNHNVCSYKTRKKMNYFVSNAGYYRVNLYKDKKCTKHSIHRLVAENFLSNAENKPTVNHKDSNRLNNNLDNLEWATYSENNQHTYNNNRNIRSKDGEQRRIEAVIKKQSKLTYKQAEEIRKIKGMTHKQLAEKYNVSTYLIYRILNKLAYTKDYLTE